METINRSRSGLAPTATTLAAVNSTNGTTLNATVNPNGWDTTVYFKWGISISIAQQFDTGDGCGCGRRVTECQQSHHGPGSGQTIRYQVVASNHLGTVSGAQVAFYSPPFVGVPNENWDSVASSADGSVLVAVANEANGASPAGPIIISTNSGATWAIATGAPTNGFWETVACSADGSKMIAAGGGGDTFRLPDLYLGGHGRDLGVEQCAGHHLAIRRFLRRRHQTGGGGRTESSHLHLDEFGSRLDAGHQCAKGELVLRRLVGRWHEVGSRR